MRIERRNAILKMYHYPDLGSAFDWWCCVGNLLQPIRSTTQVWVVIHLHTDKKWKTNQALLVQTIWETG